MIQLVLAILTINRESYPVHVIIVMDGISGALELNALPKDDIKNFFIKDNSSPLLSEDGLLE